MSSGFKGENLRPGDNGYDSARQIWNAMIDKHPAAIARCATVSDVVRAVNSARDNGLLLNFLTADEGSNYRRLAEVKRKYDPSNLFRMNQNIEPA